MSSNRDSRQQAQQQRLSKQQEAEAAARRKKLAAQLGAVLLTAVLVVGAFIVISQSGSDSKKAGSKANPAQAKETAELFADIPQKGFVLGSPKAKVVLTEFIDFQCPVCQRYSEEIFSDLVREYVYTDKIRVETKVLRFLGPDSDKAAHFAVAASQQNLFYEFAHLFYLNQGEENSGYVTDDFLNKIGTTTTGLDVEKATAASKAASVEKILVGFEDFADSSFKEVATPSFLISVNGGAPKVFDPGLDPDEFKKALDKEIAKAEGK